MKKFSVVVLVFLIIIILIELGLIFMINPQKTRQLPLQNTSFIGSNGTLIPANYYNISPNKDILDFPAILDKIEIDAQKDTYAHVFIYDSRGEQHTLVLLLHSNNSSLGIPVIKQTTHNFYIISANEKKVMRLTDNLESLNKYKGQWIKFIIPINIPTFTEKQKQNNKFIEPYLTLLKVKLACNQELSNNFISDLIKITQCKPYASQFNVYDPS